MLRIGSVIIYPTRSGQTSGSFNTEIEDGASMTDHTRESQSTLELVLTALGILGGLVAVGFVLWAWNGWELVLTALAGLICFFVVCWIIEDVRPENPRS